ncbi:hypothetical protein DKX38_026300 [Salix brachista]|uniref:GPI-anchored protein LLG1-like domain-containing protein n=1 Tax=Salix brachista TaxID=2182728 RepID=A0A5N5JRA6_9ROSI|nr:hypothetical protein DKX38_026300 [Salix brachista]
MGLNQYFTFVFFIGVLTGLFASPSFASTFISDGVFESHASLGRNLLQTKKACPVNFEFLNYTIITSQCKGPLYLPGRCCGSFKDFACPYADVVNDLTNDCATIMFSYINLYGKYPPGLFANECKEGTLGLACPALPPSELANDQNGSCKQHWLQLWELKNLVYIINCCYRMASFLAVSPLPMERNLLLTTTSRTPATIISLRMSHNFQEVKQLHAQFVVSGLLGYHPLCARRLLEAYATMSQIYYAVSIFERMPSPDVFVYNTMIRGLTMGKFLHDSLLLYKEFLFGYLVPDNYTYTFVLKACSHLKAPFEGKQVHCQMIKAGIVPDTYIHSSLIHMYANSGSIHDAERVLGEFSEENTLAKNAMISGYLSEGRVDKARRMFDNMTARDAASWSALIAGYTKNGMHTEALALFLDMMVSQILPNEAALVSLLSSCGQLGTLHQGRWVHGYIDKTRVLMSTKLTTALIDMYAKCGSIECGYGLFQKMAWRDVVTWGVMISAFAIYGHASKCFQLFDEMLADGIRPNEVIFVAILSACSHAGCVEEGRQYFSQMEHGFGIKPSIEHYGCMIDLLGRAGLLADAEELILSMPEQPNSIIWGSLLSACRTHNDLKRGTWAFENLTELEPTSGDRYKLAGLMFANAGEKEEAAKMRKMIHEKEMETTCGSSFIEVEGAVHEFTVG